MAGVDGYDVFEWSIRRLLYSWLILKDHRAKLFFKIPREVSFSVYIVHGI